MTRLISWLLTFFFETPEPSFSNPTLWNFISRTLYSRTTPWPNLLGFQLSHSLILKCLSFNCPSLDCYTPSILSFPAQLRAIVHYDDHSVTTNHNSSALSSILSKPQVLSQWKCLDAQRHIVENHITWQFALTMNSWSLFSGRPWGFSLLSNLSLWSIQSFSNSPTAFNSVKKFRNSLKLPSIHENSFYPIMYNPETEHCLCCLHTLERYNKNKHVIDTTIPHINPFGSPPVIYWIMSKILTRYSLPPGYLLALLALFLPFCLGLSTMLCLAA